MIMNANIPSQKFGMIHSFSPNADEHKMVKKIPKAEFSIVQTFHIVEL